MSAFDSSTVVEPERLRRKSQHAYPDGVCRRVARFAKILSVVLIVYAIAAFSLALLAAYGFADPRIGNEAAIASADFDADRVLILVASGIFLFFVLERLLFFTCAFLVCRFSYRAMKNLYTVGSIVPEKSPAASVYWYFVPFASFVVPPSAMSEIYEGSIRETGKKHASRLVGYWWAAWLVSLLASAVSNNSLIPVEFVFAPIVVSSLFSAIAALLLRQLIGRIAAAQKGMLQSGMAETFA